MERIEYVVWIDSASAHEQRWYDREDLDLGTPLGYCYTCGFLIGETDEHVTIAHTICELEVGPFITIPKVAIRSRLLLGEDTNEATPACNDDRDCDGSGSRCDPGVPALGPDQSEDPSASAAVGWAARQASVESGTR